MEGLHFTRRIEMNPVTLRYTQILQCLYCDKETPKLSNIKDHIKTHIATRPFKCLSCGSKFNYAYNLKRHKMTRICLSKKNRAAK